MRLLVLSISLFLSQLVVFGAEQDDSKLVHNWRQEIGQREVKYISNYKAPVPFSLTGEPEATLTMEASKIQQDTSLSKIIESEINEIRKITEIGEYLEADGKKPVGSIAAYTEKINGHEVAFIKYRAIGIKGKPPVQPRSVIHAILIKNEIIYYVHLIVLFAGHQEEVRTDQIRLIKAILRH
jgi:hypothetical protein